MSKPDPAPAYSLHEAVFHDLRQIVSYLAMESPQLAARVEQAIFSSFDLLARPRFALGRPYPTAVPALAKLRRYVIPGFRGRYLVFYFPAQARRPARILYVHHAARDRSRFFTGEVRA